MPAGSGNQASQFTVALPVHDQQNQLVAIVQGELTADDEMQAKFTGGRMGPDNPGNTAFVGQGKRAIPKLKSSLHQFTRVGSPP